MFRVMRRKRQQTTEAEALATLDQAITGVLAVNGDQGYPYTIPVNYVLYQGKIYIHCAKDGHKKDAIERNAKVSFCVVDQDEIVPSKFATNYLSVVVFATAQFVTDDELRLAALRALNKKYAKDYFAAGEDEIKKSWSAVAVIELTPQHITGKKAGSNIQAAAREQAKE